MKVEQINSFEQTDKDEFTLVVLTDIGSCRLTMDTHSAAHLHDRLVKEMREYIFERDAVGASLLPPEPSDDKQWPGESPLNFYRRTGNTDAILDYADRLCKVMKESR